jgi:hypothetical protein
MAFLVPFILWQFKYWIKTSCCSSQEDAGVFTIIQGAYNTCVITHLSACNKFKVRVPHNRPEGPGGGRRIALLSFLTSALEGGGWSALCPGCFTPGKQPVPTVQEAGWAPGLVWTCAKNLAPHRDSIPGPSSLQPVAIPTELFVINLPWTK